MTISLAVSDILVAQAKSGDLEALEALYRASRTPGTAPRALPGRLTSPGQRECRERRGKSSSPENNRCVKYERRRGKASRERRLGTSYRDVVPRRLSVTLSNQLLLGELRLFSVMPLDRPTLHTWLHHCQ